MSKRRRSQRYEEEQLQLEEVLEPYQYAVEPQDESMYPQADYQGYPEPGYADYLPEEEPENRFGVAVHVFDVISSLVGVFVILLLVAMLLSLVNWLRTDLMHSIVLLQSGIS
jgi:hypothetical protein